MGAKEVRPSGIAPVRGIGTPANLKLIMRLQEDKFKKARPTLCPFSKDRRRLLHRPRQDGQALAYLDSEVAAY